MAQNSPATLLITATGTDRPGVTAAYFATLAGYGVEVLDVEQSVLRGRIVLSMLVSAPTNSKALTAAIGETARVLGMDVEVREGSGDNRQRREGRALVTLIGERLPAR